MITTENYSKLTFKKHISIDSLPKCVYKDMEKQGYRLTSEEKKYNPTDLIDKNDFNSYVIYYGLATNNKVGYIVLKGYHYRKSLIVFDYRNRKSTFIYTLTSIDSPIDYDFEEYQNKFK